MLHEESRQNMSNHYFCHVPIFPICVISRQQPCFLADLQCSQQPYRRRLVLVFTGAAQCKGDKAVGRRATVVIVARRWGILRTEASLVARTSARGP